MVEVRSTTDILVRNKDYRVEHWRQLFSESEGGSTVYISRIKAEFECEVYSLVDAERLAGILNAFFESIEKESS